MDVGADNVFHALVDTIAEVPDLASLMRRSAEALGRTMSAKRALFVPLKINLNGKTPPIEWAIEATNPAHDEWLLLVIEDITRHALASPRTLRVDDASRSPLFLHARPAVELLHLSSILAHVLYVDRKPVACVCLFRGPEDRPWSEEEAETFDHYAELLEPALSQFLQTKIVPAAEKIKQIRPELSQSPASNADRYALYQRLVENSDAIIFATDRDFTLRFISRRAMDFLGSRPEDYVERRKVSWIELVHPEDRERVQSRAEEASEDGGGFEEEFRVTNHVTGRVRWLLTRLVPITNEKNQLVGWDGFALDITARREAQSALDIQSKKVRALYTVSSAIRGYLDPSNIAARGLSALCTATGADAGICFLFSGSKERSLRLIAHQGFSAEFLSNSELERELGRLMKTVAEESQPLVIADMAGDSRVHRIVSQDEGFASAVLVPVAAEDEVFGALALFHRQAARFDGGDVLLVSAAANQIALASRQASLFTAYRKQTKNLSALYRMSHELSHLFSLEEIFRQAFTIIRDELGLKRLWLGLLDESGGRIVGQAAYGPGWRRRLVEINVDILSTDNPIRRVIQARQVTVIRDPNEVFGALGLKRFVSRFAIKAIGLAPLVARGQVLGVLAVQPGSTEEAFDDDELALLSSLANEIATLILTKRLEEQISEGDKMRSAGLLAAGIAHNFNNLLQAVLGQASLLEMQGHNAPPISKAARIISESATKGAGLVKQLLSFANMEEPRFVRCNPSELLEREMRTFERLLRSNQQLKLHARQSMPTITVDSNHVVRIITALISNASEAMRERGGTIDIFLDTLHADADGGTVELPEGSYVRIGVRDTGIGMDAETKRRCFEPFFTTKDLDPGSGLGLSGAGLGLAAAYALARRNGGILTVESKLGVGSIFTLYLPVEQPVRKLPAADKKELHPMSISGKVEVEQIPERHLTARKEVGPKQGAQTLPGSSRAPGEK